MLTEPIPQFDILRTGYYRHTNPRSRERTIDTCIIELFRLESGSMTIDGREFALVPDLLVCTKPGMRRSSVAPFECWFVHFTAADESFMRRFSVLPTVTVLSDSEELIRIFRALHTGFSREDAHASGIRLAELMHAIEYAADPERTPHAPLTAGEKAAVSDAAAFIQTHYSERIRLADIAAAAHLSPNYLHAMFHRAVGETPAGMLTRLRMEHAAELLNASDHSIGRVAELCGYESQTYFAYVFRRRYGLTPREYRERGIY